MPRYLGLQVEEVQPIDVNADVDSDDLVAAGSSLGEYLTSEKGCSVRGNIPAVLEEHAL